MVGPPWEAQKADIPWETDAVLSLAVTLALLVAGAALLTAGAEAFAENVTGAADRLGVSVLALAVLLAGAEPEEAVTAALASAQGHPALAAGDAIGANLVVLTLTLGLAALVTRLPVDRRSLQYAGAAAVLGLVAVLLLRNGVLGRAEGLLLVLLYVAGVALVWRRERTPPVIGEMAELEEDDDTAPGAPATPSPCCWRACSAWSWAGRSRSGGPSGWSTSWTSATPSSG